MDACLWRVRQCACAQRNCFQCVVDDAVVVAVAIAAIDGTTAATQ